MGQQVLVIGLGRFGSAVARELHRLGHEVLAIDSDERIVNDIGPHVTHAMQLDATDEEALRAAGAAEFEHAVVSISRVMDASIFAVMALRNMGVPNVIAKAANALHGSILERVGASRVVLPEQEMGQRVAHLFAIPNAIDYLDVGPRFGIATFRPTPSWVGRPLRELAPSSDPQLTLIAIRRGERVLLNPVESEVIEAADELILIGRDDRLELVHG